MSVKQETHLPLWDRLVLRFWHAPRSFLLASAWPAKLKRENLELRRQLAELQRARDEQDAAGDP